MSKTPKKEAIQLSFFAIIMAHFQKGGDEKITLMIKCRIKGGEKCPTENCLIQYQDHGLVQKKFNLSHNVVEMQPFKSEMKLNMKS